MAVASAAAVVATMFVAPGQRTSLGSGSAASPESGFVAATGQHFVISRLTRLEDGVFSPVSTAHSSFRHV